jgi:hypothetical protein
MEGRIIQFNIESQQGYIRTKEGKVYKFSANCYRGLKPVIPGEIVDFEIDFNNRVKHVDLALPIKCLELLTRLTWDY